MAKKRPSFGESVSKGFKNSYQSASGTPPEAHATEREDAVDLLEVSAMGNTGARDDRTIIKQKELESEKEDSGINPYYEYHPKKGSRGRALGAPRKMERRTQISIGCTEREKTLYKKAADADGRKLSEFVNRAIMEYIKNHNIKI